ncbi:ATP-binding cassette domain-containing protein [Weissella coleopterorum]|uniref:ATP-binding cassette domain-containing protein n=1 Tax=Weissella coleopterorum TaxID=2714949 RepID=A0A6G8AZ20_9LACO|nr:ATP-binding cassette domain-containing protein [Weissella coleopterorum]QIL50341.1 ATP-binding cassette domain-containing protein [Weissella coleopterorum]
MDEIQVRNLTIAFEQPILKDLNFTASSGDWITLVGKSGSGKSLFLKALARLHLLNSGRISLNGINYQDYAIGEYRLNVSYVVQAAQLFGETVRDNLDLPFLVRKLAPDIQKQLNGLTQMDLSAIDLDRPITELSGGQKQRIGLLRNLLFPPKVLLLDEISTGLDEETKELIWSVLKQIHHDENNIILSVTHDHDEIKAAEQIYTFESGQMRKIK